MIILLITLAIVCFGFVLRWFFQSIRATLPPGEEHRGTSIVLFILGSFLINAGVFWLTIQLYAHYHILARARKTGFTLPLVAMDFASIMISVVLIVLLSVFLGLWKRQSLGKSEDVSLHTEVSAKEPLANVWPPPPRP